MDFRTVVPVIKQVMKNKKITYPILADKLNMSESGIKKVLNAKDCPFGKLNAICDAIGLPLKELMEQTELKTIKEIHLTAKQEDFLFKNQDCFHFYWKLTVEQMSTFEIEQKYQLPKNRVRKFLTALDRLDLIRLGAGDKIQIPDLGLVRWVGNGPLLNFINKEWSRRVLDQNIKHQNTQGYLHKLKFFMLRPESIRELSFALEQILDEFSVRSAREKLAFRSGDLKPLSMVVGVMPNSFVEAI